MQSPRVTCIMPTANRRAFVPRAIRYFLAQDYPDKELLVLDDGDDPVGDLAANAPGVRYLQVPRATSLGGKRNLACREATGTLIAHWDDDDWYAPTRLSVQVAALVAADAGLCGLQRIFFVEPTAGLGWEYRYRGRDPWLSGSTLLYRKSTWERTAFADVSSGEDGLFVRAAAGAGIAIVRDPSIHVGLVHAGNTSPKRTVDPWWSPLSPARARVLLDCFDAPLSPGSAEEEPGTPAEAASPAAAVAATSFRHLYACLVHERGECAIDLCRNLLHLDPASTVLVYDGGADPAVIRALRQALGDRVAVHPEPRPMKWGTLHEFALDVFRWARLHGGFDAITIVDSDQLALRPGWSRTLSAWLADRPDVGLLSNDPRRQPRTSTIPPVRTAWEEFERWRPFLRRFPDGEDRWVHWCFWPSTVFTGAAANAVLDLFDGDPELRQLLRGSRLWATEEILFPTLVALLGYAIASPPGARDWVQYRVAWSQRDLRRALATQAWWMHPVPREYGHALRQGIRAAHGHYFRSGGHASSGMFRCAPILDRIARIEGWLEPDEGELLVLAVREALGRCVGAVVEVGSYLGRGTVAIALAIRSTGTARRFVSIEPHRDRIGAADTGYQRGTSSPARLAANLAACGVTEHVETLACEPTSLEWSGPIALLFIDGLHDYPSVAADLHHFAPAVEPGGLVALHDCADYFPGVQAVVEECLASGGWALVDQARTLVVLRKVPAEEPEPLG